MKAVWKYVLPVKSIVIIPMQKGAKILNVDNQHDDLYL